MCESWVCDIRILKIEFENFFILFFSEKEEKSFENEKGNIGRTGG
jgi:hypothetical protein